MSYYSQWQTLLEELDESRADEFQTEYYDKETAAYAQLLAEYGTPVCGTVGELVVRFDMQPMYFLGFLDGINSSLKQELQLGELDDDSEIVLDFDAGTLYRKMLEVKAAWLFGLDEWNVVLGEEQRRDITRAYRQGMQAVSAKIDRNAPCPCGSGKKYKKCCGAATA